MSTGQNEKSYYYYSNNLFDSNNKKNEFNKNFELSYIGKSQNINKKFFSPIPTNVINTYKNTLLKNYISNNEYKENNMRKNNDSNDKKKSEKHKYRIMDTFNKILVDGNEKYNELLYRKIIKSDRSEKNDRNELFPKINNDLTSTHLHNRTKNYFFRTRKKSFFDNNNFKSNLI